MIIKSRVLLVLILHSLIFITSKANIFTAKMDSSIVLTGKIVDTSHVRKINIRWMDYFYDRFDFQQTARQTSSDIEDGKFKLLFNVRSHAPYIQIYSKDLKVKILFEEYFLVAPGSVISIDIEKDNCSFSGKGADLLECQYKIYKIRRSYTRKIMNLQDAARNKINDTVNSTEVSYYQLLQKRTEIVDEIISQQFKLLNDYKDRIGVEYYSILRLDILGDAKWDLFTYISIKMTQPDQLARRGILRYYMENLFSSDSIEYSSAMILSRSYIRSIAFNLYQDFAIPIQVNDAHLNIPFGFIYDKINNKYSGSIREKLLLSTFLHYDAGKPIPDFYYDDARKKIKDKNIDSEILKMFNRRGVGKIGYNFELKDTSGNLIKFVDLKGKVVILDFWYTGCQGCASLAKAMKPIITRYKGEMDIRFVSISIDKDFRKWKESIRKEIYSDPECLNLYTNGEGHDHPVIKHYLIKGYPLVIIFDKQGKIAAYDPQRPFSLSDKLAFISTIDNLIAN